MYCSSLSQNDGTKKTLFKELSEISRSTALVLTENLNLPDLNCEHHIININRSMRFLKYLDGNFLVQVLRELMKKGAFLDL